MEEESWEDGRSLLLFVLVCEETRWRKPEPLTLRSAALCKVREGAVLRHDPRIVFDYGFRRVVLAVDGKLHLIRAGLECGSKVEAAEAAASSPTTAAAAEALKSCGRSNRLAAKIPLHTIDARVFRARDRAHDFAGVVTNRDLHVS